MITLSLPYPPSANRLWTMAHGRTILSGAAKAWKAEAMLRALVAGCRVSRGDIAVEIVLHPRMTKTGAASHTRIDVDAPIKVCLDALQGVAYDNDKQVTRVSSCIGEPMQDGGLTVRIIPCS